MDGNIMDLLLGAIQGDQTQVPYRRKELDPLTDSIMHQPISYANQDNLPSNILANRASAARALDVINNIKGGSIDWDEAQNSDMGAVSNPEMEQPDNPDVAMRMLLDDEWRRRGGQKLNPGKYPPGYSPRREE